MDVGTPPTSLLPFLLSPLHLPGTLRFLGAQFENHCLHSPSSSRTQNRDLEKLSDLSTHLKTPVSGGGRTGSQAAVRVAGFGLGRAALTALNSVWIDVDMR